MFLQLLLFQYKGAQSPKLYFFTILLNIKSIRLGTRLLIKNIDMNMSLSLVHWHYTESKINSFVLLILMMKNCLLESSNIVWIQVRRLGKIRSSDLSWVFMKNFDVSKNFEPETKTRTQQAIKDMNKEKDYVYLVTS